MNDYATTLHAFHVAAVQELDGLLPQLQPPVPIIAVLKGRVADLTRLIQQEEPQWGSEARAHEGAG